MVRDEANPADAANAAADAAAGAAGPPAGAPAAPLPSPSRRRARERRSAGGGRSLLLMIVAFGVLLWLHQQDLQARHRQAWQRDHGRTARSGVATRSYADPVDRFVAETLAAARDAARRLRPTALQPLPLASFGLPSDFRLCQELVAELARAPVFVPGQAQKLAALGRPVLLAAVAQMQGLDYADAVDRLAATHLAALLARCAALDALAVETVGDFVGDADSCRLQALADAWRRFALQFAGDEARFQALLRARRRTDHGGER